MWERTPLGPTSSPLPGAAVRTNRKLLLRNELAPGFDAAVACPGLRAPYPISRGELVALRPPGALQRRGMAHWTLNWVAIALTPGTRADAGRRAGLVWGISSANKPTFEPFERGPESRGF